ncbi:hypothetical protein [Flavobacterium psychrotolerans]|uniref:Lipoprotein n=1 Tax=Flavobacterium psychrotolerans TaxID=2169410 RepID=A0A2U1JMX4_9FLAO|nr:hypothetical protein [Flavobacterium psychrotolerans]PWA06510.1 hypothetical protein DB895_03585 [Flavobacterium psychrotolerans]
MKTKNIFFGLVLSLFLISCHKDEIIPTIGEDDVATDIGLQEMSEDVNAEIISQTQRNLAPLLLGTPITQSCPKITTTATPMDVLLSKPIKIKYDYGTGCTNSDNKYYEGIINVTLSDYIYDALAGTFSKYTLECEYINFANTKYKLNGTSNIANLNQTWTIGFNHTAIALLSSKTYTRIGSQIREYTKGITPNEDKVKITGNWVTTTEKGAHNVKITTPFIIDFSCEYKAKEGVMTITRASSTAIIDYGYKKDPLKDCDNWYQLTINKFSPLYLQFGI